MIEITEAEAGALDALAGYGVDAFLRVFYKHMGEAYLKPYEAGLRSLLGSVRGGECSMVSWLDRTANARDVFHGRRLALRPDDYRLKPKESV